MARGHKIREYPCVKTNYRLWKNYLMVVRLKADVDGNVTVYEARFVAKSFSQVQGVDYDEIFSSVAMLKSVGFMLAVTALFMKSCRYDVKILFP